MTETGKRAVVLLSGGLDSATTMAVARHKKYETYALSFRYGQRHATELDAARKVAASLGAAGHVVTDIDLRVFGGSALTDDIAVPHHDSVHDLPDGVPVTYVPARNTIFLSYALAWAEMLGARDIFIGVNVLDHSGYPDCRPEYIAAFERMANLATKAAAEGAQRVRIRTPLISSTKAEVIQIGTSLGVDFSLTWSCYEGGERPCGTCDSCLIRQHGFAESGMEDPCTA